MTELVFDLDETLVSTREAHRAAYRAAGIPVDEERDHLPARFWLHRNDLGKLRAKHEAFPEFLRVLGKRLPAMGIFAQAASSQILTGTSFESVVALRGAFDELRSARVQYAMGPEDKIRWFLCRAPGLYFDDNANFVARVNQETTWRAIDVSGL